MGSFENRRFYEKLQFLHLTAEICLKSSARRTVLAITLEQFDEFQNGQKDQPPYR